MAKHYLNTKKGSARKGQHYTLGAGGSHVYAPKGGKRVVIGGQRPSKHRAAPYDPLQPLGGKGFNQEVNQIVGAKYDPQQRELQSQQRISGANLQRTNDWYDQYRATLAANNAQNNAQAQQGVQGQQTQVNTAASQDEQNRQRLQAEQEASAKLRGATIDPGVQSQALQASQARRAIGNAGISQLQNRATANATYGSQMQNVAAGSKLQALNDEAARGRQLQKLGRDLTAERGQYKGQVRGQLRDTERTYALNRQAYQLNVAQAGETQRHHLAGESQQRKALKALIGDRRFKRMLASSKFQLDQQKFGYQQATDKYLKAHGLGKFRPPAAKGGGGPSNLTPTQTRTYQKKYKQAIALVESDPKWDPNKSQDFIRALTAKGIEHEIAVGAVERVKYGGVSTPSARRLHALGIHPKRRKKAASPGAQHQGRY